MADGAVQSEGSYRPGYELVAERILQLIAEPGLRPGDRMPTEKELAARLDASNATKVPTKEAGLKRTAARASPLGSIMPPYPPSHLCGR